MIKIGILTPEINKENGYRYYLLHHLEKLDLILGIKYLGISLTDIKNTIKNENIQEYKNLIITQEEIIHKKIKELQELENTLINSKVILDKVINFYNEYDFSKLKVVKKNYKFYSINLKNILNSDLYKNNKANLEKELATLSQEPYFYIYTIKDNKYIEEDENRVLVKESNAINSLVNKYSNSSKSEILKKNIKGNFISVDFYGTIEEIHHYIILLNKYFKTFENNKVYVRYEFYLPKKNVHSLYLVNINLEVNEKLTEPCNMF